MPEAKTKDKHVGWKGHEEMSGSFLLRMRTSAELRSIEFSVSNEYLWELYLRQNKKCAISGLEIKMPTLSRELRDKENDFTASLDRIDSSKAYVEGNLQWVCKRINYMKHTLTQDKFIWFCKKISERNS